MAVELSRALLAGSLALALFVSVPTGEAADAEGNFALRGIGAGSCAETNERISQEPEAAMHMLSWLLGYVTAINRHRDDTFDVSPILEGESLLHLMAGLCSEHPDAPVEAVVNDLLETLAVARVRASSDVVETAADGQSASIRQETLVRIQERLIELGHLDGAADGLYGPMTRGALEAYQADQDISVTGIADPVTIVRLLVEGEQ